MGAMDGFILLDKVDSTNNFAKTNFFSLQDGDVVAAVEQTAGKGRVGRKWFGERNKNLAVSAVFKNIAKPFHAGVIVGMAGLELVREALPGEFSFFKWPNDIYINSNKVSGILSEGVWQNGQFCGVVSGIGINVNQDMKNLRENNIAAISLMELAKREFFLEKLRIELAKKIRKSYIIYRSNPESILHMWQKENHLIGEVLEVITPDGVVKKGKFAAISDDGSMVLQEENGSCFEFSCGDVKIDTGTIDFDLLKNKKYKQPIKNQKGAL